MKLPFFSRSAKRVVGIDCGGHQGASLACLARPQPHELTLESCASMSWDGEDPGVKLAGLVREQASPKTPAVGLMPLQGYSLLQVEAPEVAREEMPQAVRWLVKDLIDYPLEEAVIDVFPAPQSSSHGRMIYAVSAHFEAVNSQVKLLKQSRLKLQALDIPELALRNVASWTPEAQAGVGLLYLGRDSGLLVIVHEQTLYVARSIQHGTAAMREAVPEEAGDGLLDRDGDIQLLLDRVVLDVQRTLDYYESTFGKTSIGTVLLAPMQDSVPGLMEHLQSNLGTNVKPLDLNALFKGPEVEPLEQARSFLALGAALREGGGNAA